MQYPIAELFAWPGGTYLLKRAEQIRKNFDSAQQADMCGKIDVAKSYNIEIKLLCTVLITDSIRKSCGMGVGNEALISLIQDKIREQYGNPHAAARSIIRSLQLKGKKGISEDTVARIYNRREDSSYMPKRESLLIVAAELGIPVDSEQATLQYASQQAAKIINVCLDNYQNAETCMLLEQFARSLGKIERYYNDYARRNVSESSAGGSSLPNL